MESNLYDIVVIGGGIIGISTALSLQENSSNEILIIEAENELAVHQTGNNSGVIHSGLYYKPGSLKAKNCAEGRELLYNFCSEHNINFENCGKIVVATDEDQLPALDNLLERGKANGLTGIQKLSKEQLLEYEPNVSGVAGFFVPQTGIVDFVQVTKTYAKLFTESGGIIKTGNRFLSLKKLKDEFILNTSKEEIKCKFIVNCAGLYCDRVAKMCGVNPGLQIVPFRGEYYVLKKEKEHLVNNLIYPVPDPRFPFLGVHFTRMINGGIEAGPNAVLAFKREGYTKKDFSFNGLSLDFSSYIHYPQGTSLLYQPYSFYNLFLSVIMAKLLPPAAIYNLLVMHSYILAGVGAFLLIKYLLKDSFLAIIGGFLFAFNPSHFAHSLGHLNIMSIQFIPFFFLIKM